MNPVVIKVAKTIGKGLITVGLPAIGEFFASRSLDAKIDKRAAEVAAETVKKLLEEAKGS